MSDPDTVRRFDADPTCALPFAYDLSVLQGRLRLTAEDFIVDEVLGYGPSGDGEHVFLTVRKRGRNTHDVARALAKLAGVAQAAVGYAGLKDRHAVTTQSFTVQLPGRQPPDWSVLDDDSLQVLDVQRHARKIRRGGLRGNRFVIVARDVVGDRTAAEQCLRQISAHGVPNYFGSQRFGRHGRNLAQAAALFAGQGRRPKRELRGLLLSAVRAQLFNQVLAARVEHGSWDQVLPGEVVILGGSQAQFMADPDDPTIAARVRQGELHPSGPLCGRRSRSLTPQAHVRQLEDAALQDWADWIDGLQRFGLDADRRPLRVFAAELDWQWLDDGLRLAFTLPAGSYATTLLRELVSEPSPD